MAQSFKPDFVFLQLQGDVLTLETVKEIKKHSGFVVNWSGDIRQPTPSWFLPMAKEIDVTCFTNMHDVKYIRSRGARAEFVQIGYDPEIYYPPTFDLHIPKEGLKYAGLVPAKKDIDIVFMGNNYGSQFPLGQKRAEMVDFLRRTYGKQFKVYGNFNKADGNVNHSQPEEAAIYRRSRIGINFSHFNLERYFSDRLLRIMGCGVTCLSHAYKGWGTDFNEKEIVIWETFEGLKNKIDYYLSHEDESEKIGMNGNKKVSSLFTFDNMVENLLKLCEK